MPTGRRYLLAFAFACLVLAGRDTDAQSDKSASAEVRTENGLHRAVFRVPQGTIRVNFPDDMAAGDTISGTVYAEPSGKDQKEQDRNSGELSGYVIEMEGHRSGSSENRYQLTLPPRVPTSSSTIKLLDKKNKTVLECRVPVDAPSPAGSATGFDLPKGGQAGSIVSTLVPAGDPGTSVTVGGKTGTVLAESPRKAVFQSPEDVIGESTLVVKKGAASGTGTYSSLGLQLGANARVLARGQTATMIILVSGLHGLKEPAWVVISNHAPHVIEVAGGVVQQIAIQPANVRSDGTFQMERTLTGVEGGGFDISVVATLSPSSEIPLRGIVDRTVDSWSRTNAVPVTAEARDLIASGVVEARPQLDEFFRAQLAFRADTGSLLDWLVRDYCFDLRDRRLQSTQVGKRLRPFRAPYTNGFLALGGAPVSLDASAVHGFSFVQYLARLLSRVTPSQPVGDLLVVSQPDQQMITIDGATGEDYFTDRSFVVSVGSHTVAVSTCKEVLVVMAYQKAKLGCPNR